MSEEQMKTKDEINKFSASKEINLSYHTKQNKIDNSIKIDINNQEIVLTYGRYKIFSYDSKGDPLFLVGPDYNFFIIILITNLIYFLFLSILLLSFSKFYIAIIGVFLNIIQFGFTIICGFLNPGLPKKEIQDETLLSNSIRYVRCHRCFFIIDKSKHYVHCERCQCCCEGFDHHCPWTSKCIGRGNIFYFYGMIVMVSIVFGYLIFALIIMRPKY